MKKLLLLLVLAFAVSVSAQLVIKSSAVKRQFPEAEAFVNNHKWGKKNGCSSDLTPTGRMPCGLKPNVSEITWWCVGTNKLGDLYLFKRTFPLHDASAKTTSTNITYSGKEMVVWKDEVQQLILRPKNSTNQTETAKSPEKK